MTAFERLPVEVRLIYRAGADADDDEISALAAAVTDWELVFRLSTSEHAATVLWPRLRRLGAPVPADVMNAALRLCAVLEFRTTQVAARLQDVMRALADAGVSFVLLKGAALALTEYESLAQRPMSDFDVLVEPANAWTAHAALRAAGWRWNEKDQPAAMFERHHHLPQLADPGGSMLKVELHTDLFVAGHAFRCNGAMIRATARPLAGTPALVPDAVAHLVYLSLHFAWSHMMDGCAWRFARDVRALTAEGFDWAAFVAAARHANATGFCYWSLRLARVLARADVPDTVLQQLKPVALPAFLLNRLELHFVEQISGVARRCPSIGVSQLLWTMAVQPPRGIRPWSYDESFFSLRSEAPAAPVTARAGRIRETARYLLRLA